MTGDQRPSRTALGAETTSPAAVAIRAAASAIWDGVR